MEVEGRFHGKLSSASTPKSNWLWNLVEASTETEASVYFRQKKMLEKTVFFPTVWCRSVPFYRTYPTYPSHRTPRYERNYLTLSKSRTEPHRSTLENTKRICGEVCRSFKSSELPRCGRVGHGAVFDRFSPSRTVLYDRKPHRILRFSNTTTHNSSGRKISSPFDSSSVVHRKSLDNSK